MPTVRLTGHTTSELGKRLRSLRKELGIKQKDATERLGLSKTSLSFIETGKRLPRRETLERLATFYGVPIEELAALVPRQPTISPDPTPLSEQEAKGGTDADGETALVAAILLRLRKDLQSKDPILRYNTQEWLDGAHGSIGFYADLLGMETWELRQRLTERKY